MQRLALWPGRAPGAAGGEGASAGLTGDAPTLSVHLPEPALATGAAVIVNPGGGYRTLASDHE
ncbi:MAG: alpha/beta hydrolase, partial [Burkholderiales bacterium]|nr:alpha/beta hydrolase [Burkholderiales bacterium]